jgi:hypothetical protein
LPWFIQYWKEAVPVFVLLAGFFLIYSFLPVIIADSMEKVVQFRVLSSEG